MTTTLAPPAQYAPEAPEIEACTDCGTLVDTANVDTPPAGCDTGVLCDSDLDEHIRSCRACSGVVIDSEDNR